LLIPENSGPIIIYLFKFSIPFLLAGFCIYGVNIFCCIKLRIANPEINDLNNINKLDMINNKNNKLEENNYILPKIFDGAQKI